MSELSKVALQVDSNQSFPNNNNGYITPAILRSYNTNVIDSTVNQTIYTADSGSWNAKIGILNGQTGSYVTTGSNTFTGNQRIIGEVSASTFVGDGSGITNVNQSPILSLNAYTQSQDTKNSTLAAYTASNNTKWDTIAIYTASFSSSDADFNAYTASQNTKNITLGYSTSSLNAYTASNDTKWSTMGAYTQSQDTKNITLAAETASLTTEINRLAAFSASQTTKNATLAQYTASISTFTQSIDTKFIAIGLLTGSYATTGSNNFKGVESIGDIAGTSAGEVYLLGRSGSLVIGNSAATPTYAALAHLSSSQVNGNTNLIFKPNSSTGDTIISGSNNIFTNPNTPTTGYKRYIGGNNNLYLNSLNGINSQITQSATTVSGATPTMNNNIFNSVGNFSINQAANSVGTHDYSQNYFNGGGTITINALAHTGSISMTSNTAPNGSITINASSASLAEIATGISGSGTITIQSNFVQGATLTNTSPRFPGFTGQTASGNVMAGGSINVTNISASAAVNANNNISNGTMNYLNGGAAGLALHTTAGGMSTNYGAMQIIASASAINATGNISPAAMTVTNRMWSGSLGVGALGFTNNQIQGGGNTYTISGSFGGTGSPAMAANGVFGISNTIFTNVEGRGLYTDFRSNLIGGAGLILTGSNNLAITASGGGYFGRFNANDGLRNTTGENLFVVGTGTSASNRKTGFLIDSGSNTFVEGTLTVSGGVYQNVVPITIASSTASLDLTQGTYFTLTLADNTTTHIRPTNLAAGVSATLVITTGTNSTASLSPILLQPAGNAYNATSGSGKIDILSLTSTNTSSMFVISAKNMI